MDLKQWLLIALAIGIVVFVLSILFRRRKKLRNLLVAVGLLVGVLPLLLWIAFSLVGFIKERPYIGNYEGDTGVQGIARLDLFNDNTFILKSDSCSSGFVQGTWEYSFEEGNLKFESTSQNMGKANAPNRDSITFTNIPICIKLAREFVLVRTGKPVTIPIIEKEDGDF